jgi:hypothetical protein
VPRKNVEAVVLRLLGAGAGADKPVRALQQFIGEDGWGDAALLTAHQRLVDETLGRTTSVAQRQVVRPGDLVRAQAKPLALESDLLRGDVRSGYPRLAPGDTRRDDDVLCDDIGRLSHGLLLRLARRDAGTQPRCATSGFYFVGYGAATSFPATSYGQCHNSGREALCD